MKRRIRLNESQLNDMVGRIVEKVIREGYQDADLDDEYREDAHSFISDYEYGNGTSAKNKLKNLTREERKKRNTKYYR